MDFKQFDLGKNTQWLKCKNITQINIELNFDLLIDSNYNIL